MALQDSIAELKPILFTLLIETHNEPGQDKRSHDNLPFLEASPENGLKMLKRFAIPETLLMELSFVKILTSEIFRWDIIMNVRDAALDDYHCV
jgi:hypothetical protein